MSLERLTPCQRVKPLCRKMLPMLGLLALTACASTQPTLTVTIPDSLRDCPRTERPDVIGLTVGKLASYSVQQAADLEVCNARRAAAVSIIEAVNKANEPKRPWWRFWGSK